MLRSTHESSRRVSMSRMREQKKNPSIMLFSSLGKKCLLRLQLISENYSVNGVMFIVFNEGKITIVYIIDIICKQCSDIIMSISLLLLSECIWETFEYKQNDSLFSRDSSMTQNKTNTSDTALYVYSFRCHLFNCR